MSSSPSISNAFIGELLVDRGLITHAQLDEALSMQERSGELLGEIVVAHFGVSRVELADALADQWERLEQPSAAGTEPPTLAAPRDPAASPPEPAVRVERRPIGEIFVEHGMITESQLESALERQRSTGDRLGEVLVADGAITRLELADALAEQWSNLEKLRPPEPKPVVPWQYQTGSTDAQAERQPGDDVHAVGAQVVEELRAGLARLRERLDALPDVDALSARIAAVEASDASVVSADVLDERLGAVVGDLASRIDAATSPVQEAVAALEERLASVGADVPTRAELDELRRALSALPRLDGDVEQALAALAQEHAALAARVAESAPPDLSGLEARVHRLEVAPSPLDDDLLADLFGRVEALDQRLGGLASEEWVGGIERQLAEQRDATSGATAALEGAVASLSQRLDQALTDLQSPADSGDELRSELASLASRVDELGARVAHTPADVDPAYLDHLARSSQEATAELRRAVEDLGTRVDESDAQLRTELGELRSRESSDREARAAVDRLDTRIAELAARLDEAYPDLAAGLGELRARLDGLEVPPDLRPELHALALRLDEVWATPHATDEDASHRLDELAARVDQLSERTPADEPALAELREVLDSALAGVADLDGRLQALAGEVAQSGGSLHHELDHLRTELGVLAGRLDEAHDAQLGTALAELGRRVDGLDDRLAVLGERDAESGLAAEVAELRGHVAALGAAAPVAGDVQAVRGWLSEVDGRLGAVAPSLDEIRARVDSLAHEVHDLRAASEDTHGGWAERVERHELDEVHARLRATSERLEALPHDLHELGARLDAMPGREELEARLAALHAALDGRAHGIEPELLHELRARIEANEAAVAAVVRDTHTAPGLELQPRVEAVEAHVAALGAREAEVDARLGAADAATIAVADALGRRTEEVAAELTGHLDALATRVDHGLGDLQHRLDAAAAATSHAEGRSAHADERLDALADRLAALEGRLGETPVGELQSEVSSLGHRLDALHGELEARERATERALRKGLAELGERLVAGEREYREAGSRLRRSIDRLGAAVVEADARIADLPLDAPADGHVAFVPTPEGYRLRVFEGPAPEVGTVLELEEVVGPLRVSRLARSPLPLDRRACAFLERLG